MHSAAYRCEYEKVKLLLPAAADVNPETAKRETAIHRLADTGWKSVVDLLLAAGVHISDPSILVIPDEGI